MNKNLINFQSDYSGIVEMINQWLFKYDRIIIVNAVIGEYPLLQKVLDYNGDINHKYAIVFLCNTESKYKEKTNLIALNQNDIDKLLKLYYMYEFTDRICVIDQRTTFGSLDNLCKSRLLNIEELMQYLFK